MLRRGFVLHEADFYVKERTCCKKMEFEWKYVILALERRIHGVDAGLR
jgi:hypothetical protein